MSSAVCLLSADCLLGQILFRVAGHLENFPSCFRVNHFSKEMVQINVIELKIKVSFPHALQNTLCMCQSLLASVFLVHCTIARVSWQLPYAFTMRNRCFWKSTQLLPHPGMEDSADEIDVFIGEKFVFNKD